MTRCRSSQIRQILIAVVMPLRNPPHTFQGTEMTSWLSTLIGGIILAVLTSVITVRLSLHRFHSERWWEHKFEAYTKIIDALCDLKRYADVLARKEYGVQFSDEYRNELEAKHLSAFHHMEKEATGAFAISKEAATMLARLRDRPEYSSYNGPPWEFFDGESKAYREALSSITLVAKKDLKIG